MTDKGYRTAGCSLRAILEVMREDEREHLTDAHPETYAKFRVAVVEWMLEVCEYFSLHATTAHAAAAYLDRLQPSDRFKQKEWQLLAVCCIIVSAKYNESEEHVPDLYTLEEITKQRLPNETVLNYELWILKKIGWKLNARTTMAFTSCYFAEGALLPTEHSLSCVCSHEELSARLSQHAEALALTALLDPEFKPYKRSALAAAALLGARQRLAVRPLWSAHLTELTHYAPTDLTDLANALLRKSSAPPLSPAVAPSSGSLQQREEAREEEELCGAMGALLGQGQLQSPVVKKGALVGESPVSVFDLDKPIA